jgi:hypothetical protein
MLGWTCFDAPRHPWVGGLLQALDVELVHLHQRRHDPARFRRVAAVEQFHSRPTERSAMTGRT